MQEQYFSENPKSKHDVKELEYTFKNNKFIFYTDNSVFSKNGIDKGSEILLKSICDLNGYVLDMGCGYGVISIILKKLYPQISVYAVDVNLRAVDLAQLNSIKNNTEITVIKSFGLIELRDIKFDYALINPPIRAGKTVVYALFNQISLALNTGGTLYVVIRTKQGAKSATDYLKTLFSKVEILNIDSGYRVLKCISK